MVGNMQRKIVVLLLCVFMVPSFVQGMDNMPVIPQHGDKVIASFFAVAAMGTAAVSSPDVQKHFVPILAAGALAGAVSYDLLRKHTLVGRINEAYKIKEEVKDSPIGKLVDGNKEITIDNINAISGNPCADALNWADKLDPLIKRSIKRLEAVYNRPHGGSLGECYGEINNDKDKPLILGDLKNYDNNLDVIRSYVNSLDNKENFEYQRTRSKEDITIKLDEQKAANETKAVDIKGQEVKMKWLATYLNVADWSYRKIATLGIVSWLVLWQIKLCYYPSFS